MIDGTTCIAAPDAGGPPRPVLHVLGAADAQLRLPRAAWAAAHAAVLASQIGARWGRRLLGKAMAGLS